MYQLRTGNKNIFRKMHYCQKYNYYKFILNNVMEFYVYITFPSFKHMQIKEQDARLHFGDI